MKRTSIYRKLLVVAGCAAIIGAVDVGVSLAATSATAEAEGTVITPIAIVKAADINFGTFFGGDTPGTLTLETDGDRTVTGGTGLATGVAPTAASFTVTGQADSTYTITLPPDFDLTSGANTIGVGTFVSDPLVDAGVLTGGTQTVNVGATLTVGANQAAGTYTNLVGLVVTVNYD